MTFRPVVLLAALPIGLAGCGNLAVMSHVPLATMSRLATFRLEQVDPRALRVAARLPESLEPRPGGASVTLRLASSRGPVELTLRPVPAQEPSELVPLAGLRKAGFRLWAYRLSEPDVARLEELRVAGRGRGGGEATIAAGVEACRRAPLGSGPLPTTTLLATDASGYFPLVEDLDLRSVLSAGELAERLPACS